MAWSPSPVYCTKKLAGRTCQPRRESHKAASKTVELNTHLLINSFHHILIKQHTLFMALLIKGLKYLLMNLILSKTMPTCMTSFYLFLCLVERGVLKWQDRKRDENWLLLQTKTQSNSFINLICPLTGLCFFLLASHSVPNTSHCVQIVSKRFRWEGFGLIASAITHRA